MKKSIITLILVLIIGTSFGQNYQVVRKIVATPDCRTRFFNSQNVQIFEVNSFDMTYNFLSNTQIQIRDYKNQVTIYKAQTSSPIFDSLPSFLDSIKSACLMFSDTAGIYGIVAGSNITIDNTNIKFPIINASGGGGGDYIPLAGTESGKPVTGNIYFTEEGDDENTDNYIGWVDDNTSPAIVRHNPSTNTDLQTGAGYMILKNDTAVAQVTLAVDKLGISSDITNFSGILGDVSFIDYYTDGSFVQKKYVDSVFSSGGGGGSTYLAKNGIYINSDTIKLGGNITENTKLDNPNSKSIQIGSDGDAMNLNVVPPFPYSSLISSYSGYDYRSAEYMSFIGVLKGLNFAPLGFSNQDMVGTFTIVGNPFDSIYPNGSVMIDGVWEDGGAVAMNKVYLTFLGGDLIFNLVSQFQNEQTSLIEGDNASQTQQIIGNNTQQLQLIEGNNASQTQQIIGDNAIQNQLIKGENGKVSRSIIDSVNNANAKEEITSTSYIFYGQKVVGSDTIEASNSISPAGFVRAFRSGSLTNRDMLNENIYKVSIGDIDFKIDSNGLKYGMLYSPFDFSGGRLKYTSNGGSEDTLSIASKHLKINSGFLGFYSKEPIEQPILPLGSSTDDVIQVLQNLGLVKEN